jgi:mannose-6-phosphate isomerase-like protein (cupin superfamily)
MTVSRLIPALLALPLAAQTPPAIENDQVRVIVVTDQPKHKSALHEHNINRVMIYLDPGTDRITHEDGRVEDVTFRANEICWSPAGGKHTSENIGQRPFRIIEVELKNVGGPFQPTALDPPKLWPKFFRIPIDNRQVRVLVERIPAKQKLVLHQHSLHRVLVNLTDQHFRVIDESGKAVEITAKAGGVHLAKPNKHIEENLSDQPFEGVVVELK